MSSSGTDGSATAQAALWGQRAGDWVRQEERHSALYEAVFEQVALAAGMRLLDVGCGAGVACQYALQRGAEAVGLDATPELLAIARTRVPRGTFYQGEMEQLPFDAASFDVVTGFNSFQYAANPVNALREARRVVRPGGRVVIAVWGRAEGNQAFVARQQAIQAFLPPAPAGAPGPFALAAEGALEALAREAGLTPSYQASVVCPQFYASEEEALRGATSGGPAVRAMQLAGEKRVHRAIVGSLSPYRLPDGTYRYDYDFVYLITTA